MPDPKWIACYETKITGFVAVFRDLNHEDGYNKSYWVALLGKESAIERVGIFWDLGHGRICRPKTENARWL
jgi:hypothetical protein